MSECYGFFDSFPIPQVAETISTFVAEKTWPLLFALLVLCVPTG
jgi:hypothetical protein